MTTTSTSETSSLNPNINTNTTTTITTTTTTTAAAITTDVTMPLGSSSSDNNLPFWAIILIGLACILALGLLLGLLFGIFACAKLGFYSVGALPSYFPHLGFSNAFESSNITDPERGFQPVRQTGGTSAQGERFELSPKQVHF
ncbi:hypothetical protein XELAEV_18042486mg [Xenopus laevis]|uniref:Uncharacterized protein n=1 Tax=Xenopus laevis TaxID=8355 RepID=A0A974H629_XENLA|nr:hypothetical protein XELAEV_18042486mg [Xenopus laevis]